MQFVETPLAGAYIIELEKMTDERGFFARSWCAKEFAAHGLEAQLVQANISNNIKKGTLRGMHYQVEPYQESKLVRCTRGVLFDQIVDLRKDSATYLQSYGVELTPDNRRAFYVPPGFAHGFQAQVDDTDAFYQVSEYYTPNAERGLRYDDPSLALVWPTAVTAVSDKDASWPDLEV